MSTLTPTQRLRAMVMACCEQARPDGPDITEKEAGDLHVVEVWHPGVPTESEMAASLDERPDRVYFKMVDVGFFKVVVNKKAAEKQADEFWDLLKNWPPDPSYSPENRLASGPSYIEIGAQVGDQELGMMWMAMGEVLGAWEVITPKKLLGDAIDDAMAQKMMGQGYVMISGLRTRQEAEEKVALDTTT